MRTAVAVLLITTAIIVVWVGLAFVAPYAISHPPGPKNPTFLWYVTYHVLPVAMAGGVVVILVAAYLVWKKS
jgi:hypothetical protein